MESKKKKFIYAYMGNKKIPVKPFEADLIKTEAHGGILVFKDGDLIAVFSKESSVRLI